MLVPTCIFFTRQIRDRFFYPSLAYILSSTINKAPFMPFLTKSAYMLCRLMKANASAATPVSEPASWIAKKLVTQNA